MCVHVDCMSGLPVQTTVAKGSKILAMDVSSLPVTATYISKSTNRQGFVNCTLICSPW